MKLLTFILLLLIFTEILVLNQTYGGDYTRGLQDEPRWEYSQRLPQAEEVSMEELIFNVAGEEGVNPEIAIMIAEAESGLNPEAVNFNKNGTWDKGLYQINDIHQVDDSCRLNALCNVRWALRKMSKEGFWAWNSSRAKWE